METLTIFTPTYNRAYILEKAYNSLKEQTNKDFIWLVIDDGSTDNTEKIVNKWIDEAEIHIEYYKKENGGKHTAFNLAMTIVKTELVMIALDSDDYLTKNAVEIILKYWKEENKNENYYGIATFCTKENGELIIYNSRKKVTNESLKDTICNNYINCSAIFTFKTNYISKFRYPEIDGERFFTESYIYMQLDKPIIWVYEGICVREFRNDGLTKNTKKLFVNNPKSWFLYNKQRMENCNYNKIKFTIYYIAFGIMSNEKHLIRNSKNKIITVCLYPVGLIGSIYLKKKGKIK